MIIDEREHRGGKRERKRTGRVSYAYLVTLNALGASLTQAGVLAQLYCRSLTLLLLLLLLPIMTVDHQVGVVADAAAAAPSGS